MGSARITTMAKTYENDKWPTDFEVDQMDDMNGDQNSHNNFESYHTLRKPGSDANPGSYADMLDLLPSNDHLKKGELPE